jgi:hypothetical protein
VTVQWRWRLKRNLLGRLDRALRRVRRADDQRRLKRLERSASRLSEREPRGALAANANSTAGAVAMLGVSLLQLFQLVNNPAFPRPATNAMTSTAT